MGAGQVRLNHRVPVGALHPQGQLVAGDGGVVDEDIDAAELFERLGEARLDLLFARHVHRDGQRLAAALLDFPFERGELVRAARRQHQARAVLGEQQGRGAADALRRPGDNGDSLLDGHEAASCVAPAS